MHPDWLELLGSLSSHSVEFMIVGATATAVHVQPRYTDDLDLWLRCTEANVERLRSALTSLGFSVPRSMLQAFWTTDRFKITLGQEPSSVDLFNFQTGVAFAEAWERRVPLVLAGVPVSFVGLADLVRIKREVDSYLNGFDLCLIEEIHGKFP